MSTRKNGRVERTRARTQDDGAVDVHYSGDGWYLHRSEHVGSDGLHRRGMEPGEALACVECDELVEMPSVHNYQLDESRLPSQESGYRPTAEEVSNSLLKVGPICDCCFGRIMTAYLYRNSGAKVVTAQPSLFQD